MIATNYFVTVIYDTGSVLYRTLLYPITYSRLSSLLAKESVANFTDLNLFNQNNWWNWLRSVKYLNKHFSNTLLINDSGGNLPRVN